MKEAAIEKVKQLSIKLDGMYLYIHMWNNGIICNV